MRELNGASPNRSGSALHQHCSPSDRTCDMHGVMRGYAGNTEAGTLLHKHTFGQRSHLLRRDNNVFGGGTERAVGLGAVTPNAATEPFLWDCFADLINCSGPIAVWNDTRILHADSKSVFAFLDIAGIDS
jgi:hypothetical protein